MSVTRDLSHWGGRCLEGSHSGQSRPDCLQDAGLSAGCSNGVRSRQRLFDDGNASGWRGIQALARVSQVALVFPIPKQQPYMICRSGDHSLPRLLQVAARVLDCGGPKSTLLARGELPEDGTTLAA